MPAWRTRLAIGLGTSIQAIALGALMMGTLASAAGDDQAAGPAFATGFSLVPVVLAAVAFVSGADRAPVATVTGMGLWLLLALPLGLMNPATGLSAGFGTAAAVTRRRLVDHRSKYRVIAVVIKPSTSRCWS